MQMSAAALLGTSGGRAPTGDREAQCAVRPADARGTRAACSMAGASVRSPAGSLVWEVMKLCVPKADVTHTHSPLWNLGKVKLTSSGIVGTGTGGGRQRCEGVTDVFTAFTVVKHMSNFPEL